MTDGITRRDFIDGVLCSAAAGAGLVPGGVLAAPPAPYPPGRSGLQGSRDEDFAVAHGLRDGAAYRMDDYPVAEEHDLAVVGAGISGLAAAHFVHKALPKAAVLILDNHDDFGGHARRNEFLVDGRRLIGYGGSESVEAPNNQWSPVALGLLRDLGIHLDRFEKAIDTALYPGLGLSTGIFFTRESFGQDKLVAGDPQRSLPTDIPAALHGGRPIAQFAADCPLTDGQRADLIRLHTDTRDLMPGLGADARAEILLRISYREFLERYWNLDPVLVQLMTCRMIDLFALRGDRVPALAAATTGYPGFQGLKLPADEEFDAQSAPYIYHFPDGNASLARLMVREMIPGAAPGSTMEDVVSASFAYGQLDRPPGPVRLRLGATVVQMRNAGNHVDLLYVKSGTARRIRCRNAIHAGYLAMLPYLCADVPPAQRAALSLAVRAPLVYVSVAMRNWRPWVKMGVHLINNPLGFYTVAKLDYPVSLGRYRFARSPDEPILVHLSHVPHAPQPLADRRAELRAARQALYTRPFADFESELRAELTRMLGPGGFDAGNDIAAITVNRWGHGYAYEPNLVSDPGGGDEAADVARRPVGRISLAGSDAGWQSYAQTAIDEAHRAAQEVLKR